MPAPDDRRTTRTPITLKIKFKSSSLDQFIERYSVDVSRGGIFIRTKEPLPVGTTLRFEFQLQDGSSLIGGEGTVVWNRAFDPQRSGVAPGMGVRFDKLTADSQRVLDRILAEKHRRGEAQLESRFDAGVRAARESREARGHDFPDPATPLPRPAPGMALASNPGLPAVSAGSHGGGFGDEPTRMMAAEQVSQLADQMLKADDGFDQDQPTRRATLDEIRRAFAQPELPSTPPGRTGSTGEQVRLGSGAASPALARGMNMPTGRYNPSKTSAMGVVNPVLHAGTVPAPSQPELPIPPSLATVPVSPEAAAALIAASAQPSEETPQKELPVAPPVAVEPSAPQASQMETLRPDQAPTLIDAPVPPIGVPSNGLGQTLVTPPPAESLGFLGPDGEGEKTAADGPPPLADSPSGISFGVDVDLPPPPEAGGEAALPSTPLDPRDFAPPAPERAAEPSPAAALLEASTAPKPPGATPATPATQPARPSSALMVGLLLLAGIIALLGIFAYRSGRQPGEPPPRPQVAKEPAAQPAPPPVKPAPPPVEKAAPPEKAEAPKKAESPEKAPTPEKAAPEKAREKEAEVAKAPAARSERPERPKRGTPEGAAAEPAQAADEPQKGERTASVTISSDPPGARVEVAGKAAGETPLQVANLVVGKAYDFKLSLRGYQDLKFRRKIQAGEPPVVAKLIPYERVVEVNSTPRGAEVLVDGKRAGRTPLTLKRLDMSKIHEIEVRKTGYAPQTAKVADTDTFDVKNGREVRTLNLVLEPAAGQKADRPEREPTEKAREPRRRPAEEKAEGKAEAQPEEKKAEEKSAEPEGKPESKGPEPGR